MQKVDNIKFKLKSLKESMNLKLQQPLQIPQMGFSDHTLHNASLVPNSYLNSRAKDEKEDMVCDENQQTAELSDQEILESTEAIYFTEGVDTGVYELKKLAEGEKPFNIDEIEANMNTLKSQHKVISKKVLCLILEKRAKCNVEFQNINETEKIVQESVWVAQKARSYLNYAKRHLTTSSLEILAAYKKRQTLIDILDILKFFQELKSTNQKIQDLLLVGNYSEAISILLLNKNQSEKYVEYTCTESLKQKLQDQLDLTEVSLDNAVQSLTQNFDAKVYIELVRAYKLLGKTHLLADLLHMNFISATHSTAFNVLKENLDQFSTDQKFIFEQMCESLSLDSLVQCLTQLCKSFWKILVCYYQVKLWHQNYKLNQSTAASEPDEDVINDDYMHEKLMNGEIRIWNDMQSKICIFIASTKLSNLKYENFIQVLSIVQRLKKVGIEFCGDDSAKMVDQMKIQSVDFFKRYHVACLDEINLFIEHEVWIPVMSFSCVTQLQEFRTVKSTLRRFNRDKTSKGGEAASSPTKSRRDVAEPSAQFDSQANSLEDESSVYGSCGYFVRFSEKSSPFENLFDQKMIEEDILAGIADETSCYYSSDSSDNDHEVTQVSVKDDTTSAVNNNTSINILRIIGRYLKMGRLLSAVTDLVISSMTELIDFYLFAVYEIFSKDLSVPGDALHSVELKNNLRRISEAVIPKMRKWPLSTQMIAEDLNDPEQCYALAKRINAVESCKSLCKQFSSIHGYLEHLIEATSKSSETIEQERDFLKSYLEMTRRCIKDMRRPIFCCVTSRAIDIAATIAAVSKIKWDTSHFESVSHNSYIDNINRATQLFAMRLEEISQSMAVPKESLWDSYCHVVCHVLVEGYSTRKCSAAGRAAMQLDFTQFLSVLELLSGTKHPVHKLYVESYLKAFYLGSSLEEFIRTNKNYSSKHLIGLINCACSNDRKLRQKLTSLVENPSDPNLKST